MVSASLVSSRTILRQAQDDKLLTVWATAPLRVTPECAVTRPSVRADNCGQS